MDGTTLNGSTWKGSLSPLGPAPINISANGEDRPNVNGRVILATASMNVVISLFCDFCATIRLLIK